MSKETLILEGLGKRKNMKLGIIQGRLSPPVNSHMQEFPENWEREFALLPVLGLTHIEWIITASSWKKNPLFDSKACLRGLPISSICVDAVIDERFYNGVFLSDRLSPVCNAAIKNNIFVVTIPLLDESNAENEEKREEFIRNICGIADRFPQMIFSFETELAIPKIEEIINAHPNFFITYDTGNATSYGIDHYKFIEKFSDKITSVHLKDRTSKRESKPPGEGETPFMKIFNLLKRNNYRGYFTMQLARGETGKEIETIKQYTKYFIR